MHGFTIFTLFYFILALVGAPIVPFVSQGSFTCFLTASFPVAVIRVLYNCARSGFLLYICFQLFWILFLDGVQVDLFISHGFVFFVSVPFGVLVTPSLFSP